MSTTIHVGERMNENALQAQIECLRTRAEKATRRAAATCSVSGKWRERALRAEAERDSERARANRAEAERDGIDARFAHLLWRLTKGKFSRTTYPIEAMERAVDEAYEKVYRESEGGQERT